MAAYHFALGRFAGVTCSSLFLAKLQAGLPHLQTGTAVLRHHQASNTSTC